jgi:hypothetical protein
MQFEWGGCGLIEWGCGNVLMWSPILEPNTIFWGYV